MVDTILLDRVVRWTLRRSPHLKGTLRALLYYRPAAFFCDVRARYRELIERAACNVDP